MGGGEKIIKIRSKEGTFSQRPSPTDDEGSGGGKNGRCSRIGNLPFPPSLHFSFFPSTALSGAFSGSGMISSGGVVVVGEERHIIVKGPSTPPSSSPSTTPIDFHQPGPPVRQMNCFPAGCYLLWRGVEWRPSRGRRSEGRGRPVIPATSSPSGTGVSGGRK